MQPLRKGYLCSIKNFDMRSNFMKIGAVVLAVLLWNADSVKGQAFTFSTGNLTYTENFDGMGTTTTYPTGWVGARRAGTGTFGQALTPVVDNGTQNSGNVLNLGLTGGTNRTLGSLASGSTAPSYGASFVNNTGATITNINWAGILKQFRTGSNATVNEEVTFQYAIGGGGIVDSTAGWVTVSGMNLLELATATTAAAPINGDSLRQNISGTATLSWPTGATLWIRWNDADNLGSDCALGIDSLVMTVTTGSTPPPPTTSIVRYQVDLTGLNAPNGVNIAGTFNGWNPTANPMTRIGTSNIYEFLDTLNFNDTVSYKFIIAGTNPIWEDLNGACNINGNRRVILSTATVNLPAVAFARCNPFPALVDVTLRANLSNRTVAPAGVFMAGNWQRPQHWQGAANQATLNNGIYEVTFKADPNTTYEYKFINGTSWEGVPSACATNGNRAIAVGAAAIQAPIFFFDSCATFQPVVPITPISNWRPVDANGVPVALGQRARITGVLHGVNQYSSTTTPIGVQFVTIDTSGGIMIRRAGSNFGITNWAEGDSVIAEGIVANFSGLLQLNCDTMIRVSTGRPLRAPVVVTNVDETTENNRIRINNLTIVSGTWPAVGTTSNLTVNNGVNTFTMRVIAQTNIPGSTQPTGAFDVIGYGGQNDASSPFTSGYQLFPMSTQDIIPVIVTQPTVEFQLTGDSVNVSQGPGASSMRVNLINPTTSTVEVKIRVQNIAPTVYNTQYSTLPAPTNDTITLTFPASATQQLVTIIVNQATPQGRIDSARFSIVSVSQGVAIGTRNSFLLRILNPIPPAIPTRTIGQIRGANTTGIPDSTGIMVRTTGVVYGFNRRATGLEFTIFDRTSNAGIGVFRNTNLTPAYNVQEGDSIRVIGTVAHFNGLGQINVDSIVVLAQNRPLVAPQVITTLGETHESRLIRINNLTLVSTNWPIPGATGSGATVRVTNGVDSFDLRIDNDVDVFGTAAPVGPFDAIGLGGQFDSSNPWTSGYQFLPRYIADIITSSTPADTIRNFNLITPPNNTTLAVQGVANQVVNVTWRRTSMSSGTGAINYSWLLDLPNGNFSAPLATIATGTDTFLNLTYGAIDTLLANNGVNVGVTVPLKWTVRASQVGGTATKLASSFNLTLTRGSVFGVSVNDLDLFSGVRVYPNPTSAALNVAYDLKEARSVRLEVVNMIGKVVHNEQLATTASGVVTLPTTALPEGVYFVRLTSDNAQMVKRFVVKH